MVFCVLVPSGWLTKFLKSHRKNTVFTKIHSIRAQKWSCLLRTARIWTVQAPEKLSTPLSPQLHIIAVLCRKRGFCSINCDFRGRDTEIQEQSFHFRVSEKANAPMFCSAIPAKKFGSFCACSLKGYPEFSSYCRESMQRNKWLLDKKHSLHEKARHETTKRSPCQFS